jgi:hypothetical protein
MRDGSTAWSTSHLLLLGEVPPATAISPTLPALQASARRGRTPPSPLNEPPGRAAAPAIRRSKQASAVVTGAAAKEAPGRHAGQCCSDAPAPECLQLS